MDFHEKKVQCSIGGGVAALALAAVVGPRLITGDSEVEIIDKGDLIQFHFACPPGHPHIETIKVGRAGKTMQISEMPGVFQTGFTSGLLLKYPEMQKSIEKYNAHTAITPDIFFLSTDGSIDVIAEKIR